MNQAINIAADNRAAYIDKSCELQYFTVPEKQKHRIKEFLYVPEFSVGLYYDDKVAEAIALNVARKVYEVFGNTEQATAMQKEIESVLQTMNV